MAGLYPELFLQEALVHLNKRWLITRHPTMPVIRSRQHKVTYIQFSVSFPIANGCLDMIAVFVFPLVRESRSDVCKLGH